MECSRQLLLVVGFNGACWMWVTFHEYQCEVEQLSTGVSPRVRVKTTAVPRGHPLKVRPHRAGSTGGETGPEATNMAT